MRCQHSHAHRRPHGLGLIELLIGLAITAILASLSYPSVQSAVLKVRRAEALALLAQCELAQAHHRSNHPAYASLAQLGIPATSPSGRYELSEQAPGASGYTLRASARGTQAADTACRYLLLQVNGLETLRASGPDNTAANGEADNRRCWAQ